MSIKNENIDVYLQPLVEELEWLCEGVKIVDVPRSNGSNSFCLGTIYMWKLTFTIFLHMTYLWDVK